MIRSSTGVNITYCIYVINGVSSIYVVFNPLSGPATELAAEATITMVRMQVGNVHRLALEMLLLRFRRARGKEQASKPASQHLIMRI